MGLMPDQFYDLEFGDYFLMRRGYIEKVKVDSQLLRFQTALICEAFIGKGQGVRFVMESWQLEEKQELTREQIKQALKQKREREELARLKKEGKIYGE
jgi:TfoX/Sxy family transcriptional regulator of competence genes